jgi:hypothetical protein
MKNRFVAYLVFFLIAVLFWTYDPLAAWLGLSAGGKFYAGILSLIVGFIVNRKLMLLASKAAVKPIEAIDDLLDEKHKQR